ALGAVTDDDDGLVDRTVGQRVEDVQDHRAPAEQVERLRTGRAHAGALTCGEDDGTEGAFGHWQEFYRPMPSRIHHTRLMYGVDRHVRFDDEGDLHEPEASSRNGNGVRCSGT